jgi:uncharacterized protein (TIGR03086 family)
MPHTDRTGRAPERLMSGTIPRVIAADPHPLCRTTEYAPGMGGISEHYRRLANAFTATVEAVPADRWESPAPCEGWTARDVVRHVVEAGGRFFRLIDHPVPGGPSVDEDPVLAWTATRDAVQAALDDPGVAHLEYDSQTMGKATFEQGVEMFGTFDLFIHGWDLARAAGLDERLDPDEVHRVYEEVQPMDQMLRTPGVCGPKLLRPEKVSLKIVV